MKSKHYEVYSKTHSRLAIFETLKAALDYAKDASKTNNGDPLFVVEVKYTEDCKYINGEWASVED